MSQNETETKEHDGSPNEISTWVYQPTLVRNGLEVPEGAPKVEFIPRIIEWDPNKEESPESYVPEWFTSVAGESNFGVEAPLVFDGKVNLPIQYVDLLYDDSLQKVFKGEYIESPVLLGNVLRRSLVGNWEKHFIVNAASCENEFQFIEPDVKRCTIQGKYGVLTIHSDGFYAYKLDNKNKEIATLEKGGELLGEIFRYIESDGQNNTCRDLIFIINGPKKEPREFSDLFPISEAFYDEGLDFITDSLELAG